MARSSNQFGYNRRPGTTTVEGKIYFGGATDPTVSGISAHSVGFRGLSTVTRASQGTYTLTFDRPYLDVTSWSAGQLGTTASGINFQVDSQGIWSTKQVTLYTSHSGTTTLVDPPTGEGVALYFRMKTSRRG